MKYLNLGSRIRKFREQKEITLVSLAQRSGLKPAELEKIEANQDLPTIADLIKISKILEVNVADIFRDRAAQKTYELVKKNDRQEFQATGRRNYEFIPLTLPGEKHLDAYLIKVPPGQNKESSEKLTHPGEEYLFLMEGRLKLEIGTKEMEIEEGDSLFIRSSTPHRLYNPFQSEAKALTVVYPF